MRTTNRKRTGRFVRTPCGTTRQGWAAGRTDLPGTTKENSHVRQHGNAARRRLRVALMLAPTSLLLATFATPAFAHGSGTDSSACSDDYVPGEGVEVDGGAIGVQMGSHPEWNHIFYSDACFQLDTGISINIGPVQTNGKLVGVYTSARAMDSGDPCGGPGTQFIINSDDDATIDVGERNSCD